MSKAVGRFEQAARDRGVSLEILRFPEGTKTAPDAARAVGCEVGQIVKSLVFMAGTEPILALTSGANRADLGRLSKLVGGVPVRRAGAEEARSATGFGIGGTPPFGFPGRVRVFMDADLFRHEVIWAAAGTPDAVFRTSPQELKSAADAEVAEFKEGA